MSEMEKLKFRELRTDEIDVRVQSINAKGCTLLLYKDARVDMNILDEKVGVYNWQREHNFKDGKLYCKVSIYDPEKKQWIYKEDVGTESNTEKQKGEASDSFKRACFNWGIGRELYTAPFIWISAEHYKSQVRNDKYSTYDKFRISAVTYELGSIKTLKIVNQRTGKEVFSLNNSVNTTSPAKEVQKVICNICEKEIKPVKSANGTFTAQQAKDRMNGMCADCYLADKNSKEVTQNGTESE